MPLPMPGQAQGPQPDIMGQILALLSGAGFKNISDGTKKLAESGSNLQSLAGMPNAPLFMAGAGLRDASNSMEIVQPLLKLLMPPVPPPPPDPKDVNAAMQMMSARLGAGQHGLQAPMGMPPMGGAPGGAPGGMPMGGGPQPY